MPGQARVFERRQAGEQQPARLALVARQRQRALQHVTGRQHAQFVAQLPRAAAAVEHRDDRVEVEPGVLLQAAEARSAGPCPRRSSRPSSRGGTWGDSTPAARTNAAMRVWPGRPHPLGATWDGLGVNVALFSEHATAVDLCLFDSPADEREAHRIRLLERTDHVWHAYLPDVRPGQLYGFRVHGPYAPHAGHRFNPSKIVLDPYARAIGRQLRWHDAIFGYAPDGTATMRSDDDLVRDDRDNAAVAPLGVGHRPGVHVGRRSPAADAVARHGHLRAARQGLHLAPPAGAAAAAGHVPRPGVGRRPAASRPTSA